QESFAEAPLDQQLRLVQALRHKGQRPLYQKELTRLQEQILAAPYQDSQTHLLNYQWAAEADLHFSQQSKHRQDENIQLKQENLDYYYLSEKLKDACEMIVRRKILRVDYAPRFLPMILREVEENWHLYQQKPAVAVHYRMYQLLNENPEFGFDEVAAALESQLDFFPKEEQQNLFNQLQNYCIERINKGHRLYLRKAFETYQTQLDKGLLLLNDQLPEWHYKNIVTIALRLDEKEWTRQFIESYKDLLPVEVADNAYRFNLASYYYSIDQLEMVLELLAQVEYSDVRYYIAAKALLLRTYYDLGEHDPLISLSEAFKQFLIRNKVMNDYRVTAFKNLLSFTQKAMLLKAQIDYKDTAQIQKGLDQLQTQVDRTEALINREWLLQKIREVAISI
ncbi:MAG: hypothetical protein KDC44_11230, partial [Phaeodactylibacter sp.]|nr:hypothetical protein [Phaeodactylibacter sp.]